MPITHTDGAEYFSKAEIETIVKERVKVKDEEIVAHVGKLKTLEPQLAQLQTLSADVATWKGKAEAAEGRYSRHTAAVEVLGAVDADTLEALEGAHAKAMSRVEESKRVDFGAYLKTIKADPSLAPAYLRGVFIGQGGGGGKGREEPSEKPAEKPAEKVDQGDGKERPAWAPSTAGFRPPAPGGTPSMSERIKGAKTLEELSNIQHERSQRRR